MPPGNPALTLDDFSFQNWEVPDKIEDLGGYQKLVKHDFPGGDIDIQTFGYFPPEKISWMGSFWTGDVAQNLYDRINALKLKTQLGLEVTLQFSLYSFQVYIHKFELMPELEGYQPYRIEMVPRVDNNTGVGPPAAPTIQSVSQMTQELGGLPGAQQAGLTPPSSPPGLVNPSAPTNPDVISNVPSLQIPTAPPANVAADLTNFQNSLLNAIQTSQGSLANVNSPALQDVFNQLQTDVAPLVNSADAGLALFGSQVQAASTLINQQVQGSQTTAPVATIPAAVNPDFVQLAQQYYNGDASQWEQIAKANGQLLPRPIGIFKDLIIPALATS